MRKSKQDVKQEALEKRVREDICAAPSFGKLRSRAISFLRTLYGKEDEYVLAKIAENDEAPEKYLTAHAKVYNAKSARAKTLYSLAIQVIKESGVKTQPTGKFRGEGQSIDWEACEKM